jgi:hypothetical protein
MSKAALEFCDRKSQGCKGAAFLPRNPLSKRPCHAQVRASLERGVPAQPAVDLRANTDCSNSGNEAPRSSGAVDAPRSSCCWRRGCHQLQCKLAMEEGRFTPAPPPLHRSRPTPQSGILHSSFILALLCAHGHGLGDCFRSFSPDATRPLAPTTATYMRGEVPCHQIAHCPW